MMTCSAFWHYQVYDRLIDDLVLKFSLVRNNCVHDSNITNFVTKPNYSFAENDKLFVFISVSSPHLIFDGVGNDHQRATSNICKHTSSIASNPLFSNRGITRELILRCNKISSVYFRVDNRTESFDL